MFTDNYLVLSQYMHALDRRIDGQTSIARPCVCFVCRTVKMILVHPVDYKLYGMGGHFLNRDETETKACR